MTTRARRDRYRHRQEPGDVTVFIDIHAKRGFEGHGVGPAAIEISTGSQLDG
jgi:hypothetical protein